MQLFLAKTEGKWLPDNEDLDTLLLTLHRICTCSHPTSWKLSNPDLFGPGVSLGEDVVHVLVVLKDAEAGVASVELSALPTVKQRHPERLKRWAAINEMVRQRNQERNEKTSTRDTNKKRKNRDIDCSIPYSNLSWVDLEPILPMEEDLKLEECRPSKCSSRST
eukprot:jgi/Phyca11/133238/e_gw1.380.5.1